MSYLIKNRIREITGDPYERAELFARDLQGWNGNSPILTQLIDERRPQLVVEVGSWKGQSAVTIGNRLRELRCGHLICIDTWLGGHEAWVDPDISPQMRWYYGRPLLYDVFRSNIKHARLEEWVTPFPTTSLVASRVIQSWVRDPHIIDVLYLDGSHDTADVLADLEAFIGLMRPGGIVIGDDWPWQSVQSAVNLFMARHTHLMTQTSFETVGEKWIIRLP